MSHPIAISTGHLSAGRTTSATTRVAGAVIALMLALGAASAASSGGSDLGGKKYPPRPCQDCRGGGPVSPVA